ncbi:MAG: SPOR domain-containing protein [Pseudomonadota bacterium]
MKRATQTRANPRGLAVLAVTLTVLSGCDDVLQSQDVSTKPKSDSADNSTIELVPQVTNSSQRDIEAPDVFSVTEAGLWDGRPSLGGIWVAHPDVNQPERVLIKNTANNKSVTGALFRRQANLPGPALQVSSAAAEKLGMLAGAPTRVSVVALRRKEPKEEPPAEEETPEAEAPKEETEVAAAAPEAETEAAAPEKPAKRKWWQKKEPAAAAGAAGAAAAAAGSASEEAAEAAVDSASAAGAAAPGLSDAPVEAPADKPAKRKWWQKKQPEEITATPLDPIEGAAAAIDAAEATPAAAAAAAPAASNLTKLYVQIGTFSVEANANTAAEKIRKNGMAAEVRALEAEDKTVWRVLVGPAATRADRKAIQTDVKDLGFTDAFTVSN